MSRFHRFGKVAAAAAIISVGAVYAASAQDTIVIGVQVPTTGSEATYGKDMANAVQIAQDEINKKGGVLGKQLSMIIGDSACDPQQAGQCGQQAGVAGRRRRGRRLLLRRHAADAQDLRRCQDSVRHHRVQLDQAHPRQSRATPS